MFGTRRQWWRRSAGRRWIALALAWAAIYLVFALAWAAGAPGYPYGRHWDPSPVPVSLLDAVPAQAGVTVIIAGTGLVLISIGRFLITATGRLSARFATSTILVCCLGLVLVGDYRPLMAVARVPIFLITRTFWHVAEGRVGVGEFVSAMFSIPALHGFWQLGGILVLLMATVEFWRRTRSGCSDCGRPPQLSWWTTRSGARRWGLIATIIAVICPIPYAVTRYMLLFGFPADGISRALIEQGEAQTPGIWIFGAGLATLGVLGAVLTLGLSQRWGERWPFWVPILRGRPINPVVAIIPAGFVSLLWPGSSLMLVRVNLQKTLADSGAAAPDVAHLLLSPMNLWVFWGFALAGATLAYWLRRRPDCATCHRGEEPMRGVWRSRSTDGATGIVGTAAEGR
ncbi:MAG TPA: hypothetical protein H9788_12820 [Candidatus Brevibacterium intestinavium]|nr:hypothetical protein [Candidatus Brevibacterium intestinavium]